MWQVNAEKLVVEKSQVRERCTTCQRLATRTGSERGPAPATTATAPPSPSTPDQENYDVWLMGRPFVMVSAEEHTAQVPGEVRNKIEQDFKSRHGRTNCLVATPTLEMGVNIGALDMALMRNVPPRPSNYWQRAGRAGREERMAVVVTYCRRSPHDRYFFDDPLRLLGGAIEAPTFNLRNPLMVAKHIRSAILSELLLRSGRADRPGERVKEMLKALFPVFIRDYLLDENDHFRSEPTSTAPLGELLAEMKTDLANRLVTLFAQHWPQEAAELANRTAIEQIISETAATLDEVIKRLHRRLTWARSTRSELHKKKDAGLIEREEEQLLRRCDEFINSHRQVRPPDVHPERPRQRGLPAGLRRLRGRRHGLGPPWLCPAVRPAGLRPVPQQRGGPAGVRARQPAVRQPGHVLRRPLPPGGRRSRPASAPCGSIPRRATSPSMPVTPTTARPGACPLTPCR